MFDSAIISLVSIALALAAVCVAAWQVRVNAKSAEKSNALPVISEAFHEWRSYELNSALTRLLAIKNEHLALDSFDELPPGLRNDAYEICYFFDYMGTLAVYDIAPEDIIIGVMANRIVQVWITMYPLIVNERNHRLETYPPEAPHGFLAYFEHLVKWIEANGGQKAAHLAQQRAGLLRLSEGQGDQGTGLRLRRKGPVSFTDSK
jgi:hypothetical protein